MWQSEHFSKNKTNEIEMMICGEMLYFCDLHDLGFDGTSSTFDNKQQGSRNVKVRLDRAVGSPNWSYIYPLSHLNSSDHCPILLDLY
jgi:hypothetical protein